MLMKRRTIYVRLLNIYFDTELIKSYETYLHIYIGIIHNTNEDYQQHFKKLNALSNIAQIVNYIL